MSIITVNTPRRMVSWLSGLRRKVATFVGVTPRGFESHAHLQKMETRKVGALIRFEPGDDVTSCRFDPYSFRQIYDIMSG